MRPAQGSTPWTPLPDPPQLCRAVEPGVPLTHLPPLRAVTGLAPAPIRPKGNTTEVFAQLQQAEPQPWAPVPARPLLPPLTHRLPGRSGAPAPQPSPAPLRAAAAPAAPLRPHSARAPDLPAEALPGARRRHSRRAAAGGAGALSRRLGAAPVPLLPVEYLSREPRRFPALLNPVRVGGHISQHAGS
ncbi:predicted GPI-anchored protein 58 [Motacilla alba alba]|uniref:predicted GPI-anchored protein 58 n=1 Tax=Motacilla alba alba TaxID=1094192 RepID=UPI0018D56431|nr:predicted GPI-anchored protein 58 [Motacilla alba alba]